MSDGVAIQTDGDSLNVRVTLTNRTGHKFPTGYPERRAWIHFRLVDGNGGAIFESGAIDSLGYIKGMPHTGYAVHQDVIRRAEDVQIYEIVPADIRGNPTRRLLSSAGTNKDNRLLPSGFQPEGHALGSDVPVVGMALLDANFDAQKGCDEVVYRVAKPAGNRARVEVVVYYQAVPPEAIDDLRSFETPDVSVFLETVDRGQFPSAEVVARRQSMAAW